MGTCNVLLKPLGSTKSGCRLAEASEIKMDDVMPSEAFVRLRERKGGKQTVVPIDQETIRAIERFKFTRPTNGDSDHLFLRHPRKSRVEDTGTASGKRRSCRSRCDGAR